MSGACQRAPRTPASESVSPGSVASAYDELWISLAALIRSYTSLHGLHKTPETEVEWDEVRVLARYGNRWLDLRRDGASVIWARENGSGGKLELTEAGRLRSTSGEEEMDMAAEAWARELTQ